jgi:hypothetical protein
MHKFITTKVVSRLSINNLVVKDVALGGYKKHYPILTKSLKIKLACH